MTSPASPTGAFAYSHGLELVIAENGLTNSDDVEDWLRGLLRYALGNLDCPLLKRLHAAWCCGDHEQAGYWNDYLFASRETRELQQEDSQLGGALLRLLARLDLKSGLRSSLQPERCCFATAFSLAAVHWDIRLSDTVYGYLWNWAESQVAAAIKLVPLGQTDGQRILAALIPTIIETAACGLLLSDDEIGCATPGLAIASCRHETQYSRLFRS